MTGHLRAPEADADLDEIWHYIASMSGSVEKADRFVDSITDRFILLVSHPNLGRARDDDLRPGLRSFSVAEYIIIYRIQGEHVVILRIIHASRNIEGLFSH